MSVKSASGSDLDDDMCSNLAIIECKAGEEVFVRSLVTGHYYGGGAHMTTFSGLLLKAVDLTRTTTPYPNYTPTTYAYDRK